MYFNAKDQISSNISSITSSIGSWNGIEPSSSDILTWDDKAHRLTIEQKTDQFGKQVFLSTNSLEFKTNDELVSKKITDLSVEAEKKLDSVIGYLEKLLTNPSSYINCGVPISRIYDELNFIDELIKLSEDLDSFRKGIDTILSKNDHLYQPSQSLIVLDKKLTDISNIFLKYPLSLNSIDTSLVFKIAQFCATRVYYSDLNKVANLICTSRKGRDEEQSEFVPEIKVSNKYEHLFVEIAKQCMLKNADFTPQNIKYFGITDQDRLFELAIFCLDQKPFQWNHQGKIYNK